MQGLQAFASKSIIEENDRLVETFLKQHVLKVLEVSNKTISQTIDNVLKIDWGILEPVNMNNWLLSPYCPTSNIIEAARKLYANHVKNKNS